MLPRANSKAPPKANSKLPPPPPPTLTWVGTRRRKPAAQDAETDYTRYIGVLRSGYEQLARDVDRWNEKHSSNFEVKCATPVEKTPQLKPVNSGSVEEPVARTTPKSGSGTDKSTDCDVRERAVSADAQRKTKPKTPEHVSQWSSSVSSKKMSGSPRIDVESLRPTKVYRQPGRSGWGANTVPITRNIPTFVNRLIILPPLEDPEEPTEKQPERSPREDVAPTATFLTEDARRPGKRSERSPRENVSLNSDRMTPPKKRQTQSDVRNIFAVPRIPRRTKDAAYRRSIRSFSRLKPMSGAGRYSVNRTHGRAIFSPYRPLPRISGKRQAQECLLVSQYSAGERSLSDMTDVPKLRNLLEKRLEKLWFGAKTKFRMLSGKRKTD